MSRLVIINGVQEGRVLHLKAGLNRIGRTIDNHLQVPDSSVSGNHCEVIFSDTGLFVRDLNSTNGTYLDGEPVAESTAAVGQVLRIGNIELRIEPPPARAPGPEVNVPDLSPERLSVSGVLEDGSTACANHPEVAAAYRCTVCGQGLCEHCVRTVRRMGGETMVFCSLCTGHCESLEPAAPAEAAAPVSRMTLLEKLTQKLHIHRG